MPEFTVIQDQLLNTNIWENKVFIISNPAFFNSDNNIMQYLYHSQQCFWGIRSSRIWYYVVEWQVPDIPPKFGNHSLGDCHIPAYRSPQKQWFNSKWKESIIFKTIIHLKIAIFWKATPCNLVEVYLMFGVNLLPPAFRKMGGSNFLHIPEHSNHH
jgi:hypothetical protein